MTLPARRTMTVEEFEAYALLLLTAADTPDGGDLLPEQPRLGTPDMSQTTPFTPMNNFFLIS